MNDPADVVKAWRFVNGFHVPRLDDNERAEWGSIIARMSLDDFQRGCRRSLDRPTDHAHLRPSPMAFRAYAKGQAPPHVPEFPKKDDAPLTESDIAAKDEWLAKCRAVLRKESA